MKIKYYSWLPAVLIMLIIFYFSSKPADLSDQSSLTITHTMVNIYETISNNQLPEVKRIETVYSLDHIVRKTAHFIEYAMLAAAFAFHFTLWTKRKRYRWFLPVLLAGIYAATDEYHQTFVEGRSGQLSDVLLDTAGAITGVVIFVLLMSLISRLHASRNITK
jgi:VanZ family protein